jgi:PP-loop superfamily ATP-utilizing enzyme
MDRAGEINARLRDIGFTYIAVDLAGYRRGSMNEGQALIKIETH